MIRIGIAGMGAAGRAFLPAFHAQSGFDLVAVADPLPAIREAMASEQGLATFDDLSSMLAGIQLDAVYLATPTDMHRIHAEMAIAAGKHVLVEKPVAVEIEETLSMVNAAQKAGVVLAVGHSHSYDLPIHKMRELIEGGALGRVRMINTMCFTDWVYRPRRPEELDVGLGGGVTFRQGAHQFDILRLLGGGMVKSVRATAFDWDATRSTVGAHVVYLQFENGTVGTAIYNGYGCFSSSELCGGVGEWGFNQPVEPGKMRHDFKNNSAEDELERKRRRAKNAITEIDTPFQPHFGLTIVSCEKGDIRQSPEGLYVYTENGCEEIKLSTETSPRYLVLSEFRDAILGVAKCLHDGRWGLSNLEICTAALESSNTGREVFLSHQVAVPTLSHHS